MKIERGAPSPPPGSLRGAAPSSGRGFSIASQPARESARAGPAGPVGALGSLEALLALQEALTPSERRRRTLRRAGRLLDALDALKIGLLEGDLRPEALSELRTATAEARPATEEPGLEGVLDEIETRAAVEIAKREAAAQRSRV